MQGADQHKTDGVKQVHREIKVMWRQGRKINSHNQNTIPALDSRRGRSTLHIELANILIVFEWRVQFSNSFKAMSFTASASVNVVNHSY